jgi:geranylgeranyl reductase family protein
MLSRFDLIVIGAGPAGAVTALEAARLGCGRVLILDQEEFPGARVCAGGLSPRACRVLTELGLWDTVVREAYAIHTVRLVSPHGREVVLTGEPRGVVMDRRRFDQILVDAAVRAGAEFRPGARADGLLEESGRVVGVRCGGDEVSARWVVAADGGAGRFSMDKRPRRLVQAFMGRFEGVRLSPNRIDLIYDRELLPHYGWVFPESDSRANIGVSILPDRLRGRSLRDVFEAFVARHCAARLSGATQVGPLRGRLLLTAVGIRHCAPPGLLVTGEANRLTNIATGEGILYAMISGRLAARAIRKADRRGLNAVQAGRSYATSLRVALQPTFLTAGLYCAGGVRALDGIVALARLRPANRLVASLFARL